jgi:hypothetical protein
VIVNVWGLHHDESKFPNPDVFNPEHYRGRIGSSASYANSADYENRDQYVFGKSKALKLKGALSLTSIAQATAGDCVQAYILPIATCSTPFPKCSGHLS